MKVLLVANHGGDRDYKVVVRLHTKTLVRQVNWLMAQSMEKEAFHLIVATAEVDDYIPAGQHQKIRPRYTLVEDIL